MQALVYAYALSLALVALLYARGCAPYRDEFAPVGQRLVAFALWVSILALVVFLPIVATVPEVRLPEHLALPELFLGHGLMTACLLAWWRLRGTVPLVDFLSLREEWARIPRRVAVGLGAGMLAWGIAVVGTALVAGVWMETAAPTPAPPVHVPEVLFWLVELPVLHKALVVLVAMTVEEAFFRAFLQPRIGAFAASACFALSHLNYGLPFLVIGVFLVSLFWSWLFHRTGHLLPCIVAHGVFDAIQLFVVLPWAIQQVA